jgi:hypothetical protein
MIRFLTVLAISVSITSANARPYGYFCNDNGKWHSIIIGGMCIAEAHSSISRRKCATAQEVPVTVLGHPFRARQMALERLLSPRRLANGIDMQHDPFDLLPIRTFRACVEQTQIGDSVFVIVRCQHQIRRRGIGDIRIERGLLHGLLRKLRFKRPSVP